MQDTSQRRSWPSVRLSRVIRRRTVPEDRLVEIAKIHDSGRLTPEDVSCDILVDRGDENREEIQQSVVSCWTSL